MPCAKCRKKKVRPTRTVYLPLSSSDNGSVDDVSVYTVQSRMHTAVTTGEGDMFRFLPGEKVDIDGYLLYRLLKEDADLFIFLRSKEKLKFVDDYPDLEGNV